LFDPEVEFAMVYWPEAGRSRGLDAMRRTWQAALGAWEDFRAEPYEFIEIGEQVVVLIRDPRPWEGQQSRGERRQATVWTLDGGKIVRLALYWDSAKALQAAGLQD
jgi:ketosteroid isomerase-like protein